MPRAHLRYCKVFPVPDDGQFGDHYNREYPVYYLFKASTGPDQTTHETCIREDTAGKGDSNGRFLTREGQAKLKVLVNKQTESNTEFGSGKKSGLIKRLRKRFRELRKRLTGKTGKQKH